MTEKAQIDELWKKIRSHILLACGDYEYDISLETVEDAVRRVLCGDVENDKCEHVFVLGNHLVISEKEAKMIPSCYWCVRCGRTLLELTGILGPSFLVDECDD